MLRLRLDIRDKILYCKQNTNVCGYVFINFFTIFVIFNNLLIFFSVLAPFQISVIAFTVIKLVC